MEYLCKSFLIFFLVSLFSACTSVPAKPLYSLTNEELCIKLSQQRSFEEVGSNVFLLMLNQSTGTPYVLDDLYAELSRRKPFSDEDLNLVFEQRVQKGMSELALYCSWGKPKSINISYGSWGDHKQFVYGYGYYVYVENGKVTSWQTSN